jgi:hypothetical protein
MKIKLLPLLFICFILIQSCEKPDPNGCHNAVIFYNYLSDAARNQTPYFTNPAFDTLSYASDKGDTITFVKTKTDSTWYKEEIRGNPACDWDKNYYQVLHSSYTPIRGIGKFDIKHSTKNSTSITISFNTNQFFVDEIWLSPTTPYKYKIGNLTVKNTLFTNTIYAYCVLGDTSSNSIIMNQQFGIIKLNDKSNNIYWTLLKP